MKRGWPHHAEDGGAVATKRVAEGGDARLELGGHQAGVTGGFEEVVEAGEELVALRVVKNETASDPAAERKQVWSAKALAESGVPGEDDAEELTGIELFAGENAQLVEDGGEGLLGLIDDEDGPGERGSDVMGPAGTQGLETAPAVVGRERDGEEIPELAIEIHGAGLGVLDGADDYGPDGLETL